MNLFKLIEKNELADLLKMSEKSNKRLEQEIEILTYQLESIREFLEMLIKANYSD